MPLLPRKYPPKTDEETLKQFERLVENGNHEACNIMATFCLRGEMGFEPNTLKGMEMLMKAGALGSAEAYNTLASVVLDVSNDDIDILVESLYQ